MQRRLYRIKKEKMLAGVSAGLAEYFDIDPVLFRIAFVLLAFQGGIGVIAYIVLWIVVPARKEEPVLAAQGVEGVGVPDDTGMTPDTGGDNSARKMKRNNVVGIGLIGIGIIALLNNFVPGFDFENLWPLVLIAAGTALLWNSIQRHTNHVESI